MVWPADEGACGFYRLRGPAEVLQHLGHDVEIMPMNAEMPAVYSEDLETGVRQIKRILPPATDTVVFQRVVLWKVADAIPLLRGHGIRVVVDFDDDLRNVHRDNPAIWAADHKLNPEMNWQHAQRAAAAADLVTASTPEVAQVYGKHGRVTVIPNCIPERYLDIPRYEGPPRAIWPGWIDPHPGDAEVTRGAVARAVQRAGATFLNVGPGGVEDAFGFSSKVASTGWVEFSHYPEAVAQATMSVAPLADSVFNRSKSWLKALESIAVGVPVVASPLPAYEALARQADGAVLIAKNPRRWEGMVHRLLTDPAHTADLSSRGRTAAKRWTIESNIDRWAEAWAV